MSTIRLPPNDVRSATIPGGCGTISPTTVASLPQRVGPQRGDGRVGLIGRHDRDELAFVGDVERVDTEHVACTEHLGLDGQLCPRRG